MKKMFFCGVVVCIVIITGIIMGSSHYQPLGKAPAVVDIYKEIITVYNHALPEFFNALTPQERVMVYYLFRASLPGNDIAMDQSHRDAPRIKKLLEHIILHKDILLQESSGIDNKEQLIKEISIYLAYLWTNHSQYFMREHADEKRTPHRLGLQNLTRDTLVQALLVTGYAQAVEDVAEISDSLFDQTIEPTLCVSNSIDKSAVNFYAKDFTDKDFEKIDATGQTTLNAFFYIDNKEGQRAPSYIKYGISQKYAKELNVAVYWLKKANEHAQKYQDQFDKHFAQSLSYLIDFFVTGEEEFFKKHSIEWLKSNSKIDYVYGFIETYEDPKSYRAIFQSDVTIKSIDINALNKLLPELEKKLPFPEKFKRISLEGNAQAIPNASINVKAFAAGFLGPLNLILAYCLPNYEEIRSEHGSKQIIYHAQKSIGQLVNPELFRRLFNCSKYYQWFQENDPDDQLMRDIFMLEVILHETLGHGSGKLGQHEIERGDPLIIGGKDYTIGDVLSVTSDVLPQLLAGYSQTIEELRAEVIALLASILFYEDFAKMGMLKDWPQKIGKEKIIEFSIISMLRTGLRRLVDQADSATEVAGAHAQANMTILNYMLEKGGARIVKESVTTEQGSYTILDICIDNLDHAIDLITQLANKVQTIKSTGSGVQADRLISTYGKPINQEYMRIMKANMKAVVGDVKAIAVLSPLYTPIMDTRGAIIDINATWPSGLQEQCMTFNHMAVKTEGSCQ